jgi:hypothetical protein
VRGCEALGSVHVCASHPVSPSGLTRRVFCGLGLVFRYVWTLVSADRDQGSTQSDYTINTAPLLPFIFGKDPTVLSLPPLQPGGVYVFAVRVAFTRDLTVFNSAQVSRGAFVCVRVVCVRAYACVYCGLASVWA